MPFCETISVGKSCELLSIFLANNLNAHIRRKQTFSDGERIAEKESNLNRIIIFCAVLHKRRSQSKINLAKDNLTFPNDFAPDYKHMTTWLTLAVKLNSPFG